MEAEVLQNKMLEKLNANRRIHVQKEREKKKETIGLVFITAEKRGKVSSSHMRATFLNMQLCYHETHEEQCECSESWKVETMQKGKKTKQKTFFKVLKPVFSLSSNLCFT